MSATGFDFDTDKLANYLEQHVQGFQGIILLIKYNDLWVDLQTYNGISVGKESAK